MLTGYASIATAVEAIKLGAVHYLAKPVDADQIVAAFSRIGGDAGIAVADTPLSVDRLEWEHIQRVLAEHAGNISATARALKMHRRTLQRKLGKRPVRE
jgi:two-component system response regulator RegA